MNAEYILIIIVAIFFFSTLVRSTIGFGDALISIPLLAFLLSLKVAVPLLTMVSCTIATAIVIKNWNTIQFRGLGRLLIGAVIGVPVGLAFLKGAYEPIMKGVLALMILAFSIYSLARPHLRRLKTEKWGPVFGFISGVFVGAYTTGGPPVVIYGAMRRWDHKTFRNTLQGYFMPIGFYLFVMQGIAGLWSWEIVRYYLYCLPGVCLAIFLGGLANKKIVGDKFNKVIFGFLILVGISLLFFSFVNF